MISSTRERVKLSVPKVFDFTYPREYLTDTEKAGLEEKILRHYYFREIGLETVAKWKFYLESRMNEIMPYYDEMYRTAKLEYNILENFKTEEVYAGNDVNTISKNGNLTENLIENLDNSNRRDEDLKGTEEHNVTTNGTKAVDNSDNKDETREITKNNMETRNLDLSGETLNSDFPQANAANVDYGTAYQKTHTDDEGTVKNNGMDTEEFTTRNVYTGKDVTTETVNDFNQSTGRNVIQDIIKGKKTNSNEKVTEDTENANLNKNYTITRHGKEGSEPFSELIRMYRETIINIDMLIIGELSDLFMNIY